VGITLLECCCWWLAVDRLPREIQVSVGEGLGGVACGGETTRRLWQVPREVPPSVVIVLGAPSSSLAKPPQNSGLSTKLTSAMRCIRFGKFTSLRRGAVVLLAQLVISGPQESCPLAV
jgi:hypothetical protein